MTTRTPTSYRLTLTVGLCFLVALMEGLDLQAAGIAAVGIAQAFALDKMQMGWIFSAGILGLLPGALVGGMLADRYGRKRRRVGRGVAESDRADLRSGRPAFSRYGGEPDVLWRADWRGVSGGARV